MSERALENVKFARLLADLSEKVPRWETTMEAWPRAVGKTVAGALNETLETAAKRFQAQARAERQEQVAARQQAANQLKEQANATARLDWVVKRLERQAKPWIWGWSRDRWVGVLIGVLATVFLGGGGLTLYWRLGPPSAVWAQLTNYRSVWAVMTQAERKEMQRRIDQGTAGK